MGKYCGDSIPPSHISSSKEIMVHFETAFLTHGYNGFKMEYNPTGKQNTSIQNNAEILVVFKKIFEHSVQLISCFSKIKESRNPDSLKDVNSMKHPIVLSQCALQCNDFPYHETQSSYY